MQNPLAAFVAKNAANVLVALKVDSGGNLLTSSAAGGNAVTVADGASVTQGTTTDAAYVSGAGTLVSILKGIFGKFTSLTGLLLTSTGGASSLLNITAAVAVKGTPGRLAKLVIVAPGTTSGAFTINDCATTGAASAANEIWTQAYNATPAIAGQVINLDWPCAVGITVSAVPGGGSPILAISYT